LESRLKELDGVRGLAILMVMAFHIVRRADYLTDNAFLHSLTNLVQIGWAGVDLFFVLSGFLITSILLRSKGKPRYFTNFYARRILRIFPLYYVAIAVVLFFIPVLDKNTGVRTQALWPFFAIYQQNWLYVSLPEPSLFLGITWSLAIEEQFYMVWPTIVHFFSRKQLAFIGIGIIVFSLLARIVLLQTAYNWFSPPRFFYYGTVTRFEGLVLGAIIALAFEADVWKQMLAKVAWPVLGLSAVLLGAIMMGKAVNPISTNYPLALFGYTLLAFFGGALVVLVTTQPENQPLRKIFRNTLLEFFGKYSYALYLLHMPVALILLNVMVEAGRKSGAAWLTYVFVSFAGTILVALLSWNILEKHALGLKRFFE